MRLIPHPEHSPLLPTMKSILAIALLLISAPLALANEEVSAADSLRLHSRQGMPACTTTQCATFAQSMAQCVSKNPQDPQLAVSLFGRLDWRDGLEKLT